MSWTRLHTLPRACRKDLSEMSAKELFLYKRSRERYFSTDDGKYVAGLAESFIPEVGRVESVRFIDNN